MNQDLPRWVYASVSKHFQVCETVDFPMIVEGQNRDHVAQKDFYELRIDGPTEYRLSNNVNEYYVNIDILLQSRVDDSNYHRLAQNVGIVAATFTPIEVFKYGKNPTDTGDLVLCLNCDSVRITYLGQVKVGIEVQQAIVEGTYKVTITN